MRLALLIACLALPVAAAAQDGAQSLTADLDRDGVTERFTLVSARPGSVDLRIETPGAAILAEGIAWAGNFEFQKPYLAAAGPDAIHLVALNEAVGSPWHLTLSIIWRDGSYMVEGVAYGWFDRIDPELGAVCVFNLVTGEGSVTTMAGTTQTVEVPWPALSVTGWKGPGVALPAVCLE